MKRLVTLFGTLALAMMGAAQPYTQAWHRLLPGGETVDTVARPNGDGVYWLTFDGQSDYELNYIDRFGNMKFSKSILWSQIADMETLADGTLALVGTKSVVVGAGTRQRMTVAELNPDTGNIIRETSDLAAGSYNSWGLTLTRSSRPALGGSLKQVILAGGVNSTTNQSRYFLRTVHAGANVEGFGSLTPLAQSEVVDVVSDASGAHWLLERGLAAPNQVTQLHRVRYNPMTMAVESVLIETSPAGRHGIDLVEVPSAGPNPYLTYAGDTGIGFFFRQVFVNRTTNAVTAIQNAAGAGYSFLDLKQFNGGYAIALKRNADSMLRTVAYNSAGALVATRFQGRSILNDYLDLLPTGATLNTAGTFQDPVGNDNLVASSLDAGLVPINTFAMGSPKMYRPSSDAVNTDEVYTGADSDGYRRLTKLTRIRPLSLTLPPTAPGGSAFSYTLGLNNKTLGVMQVNIASSHPNVIAPTFMPFPANASAMTRSLSTVAPVSSTNVTLTMTIAGGSIARSLQVTP